MTSSNLTLFFTACIAVSSGASARHFSGGGGGGGGGARGGGGAPCATACAAEQCDSFGIRWGRFCGVTHTGCPGVAPCDEYDSCCSAHDGCVSEGGLGARDVQCHADFTACLARARAAGAPPWSNRCSVAQVVKTMTEGITMASSFARMLQQQKRRGDDL